MYDPTIFENLKVAIENQVYDLDNIDRKIAITNRFDRMDFSIIKRDFGIQFTLVDQQDVKAEIIIEASIEELAAEILEQPGKSPGCSMYLRFYKRIQNVTNQCKEIEESLNKIWEPDLPITQALSFVYVKDSPPSYLDIIEVAFNHKINEEHMGDIKDFLEHVISTLEVLNGI
ncbi:hypothetical protein [Paenisporosarcina indica]|uniref:hypothetical protein n=1 Tax=Paenisporosarcina indica TaxID=650093 RepID=UPI00094F6B08|nr:hypothetical protein [Paenisporosarcina indica]